MKRIIINVDGVQAVTIMNYLIQRDIDFSVRTDSSAEPDKKADGEKRTHFRGNAKSSIDEVMEFLSEKEGKRANIEEIKSFLSSKGFKSTTAGPAVSRLFIDGKVSRAGGVISIKGGNSE